MFPASARGARDPDGRRLGNPGFALECATVTPSQPVFFVVGLGAQAQPVGSGCTLLVGQPVATLFWPGTAMAQARLPMPIPNDPGLRGIQLVAQAAVLDVLRSPIGSVTTTAALRVSVGD